MKRISLVSTCAFVLGSSGIAQAMPAPDAHSVLILETTVSSGLGSLEATQAVGLGLTPVVVDSATWGGMSAADFATYRALILGDPTCAVGVGPVAAAEANRTVWGSVVDGNIVLVGSDPTFHSSFGPGGAQGGDSVAQDGIAFAADEPAKTGLYATLSCYYHGTAAGTAVPLLDQFGSFTVRGVGCFNNAHKVAVHPALAGLTDGDLSNWGCSVHEAFDSFPVEFLPLAIARDAGGVGSLDFADGSSGVPYVLARGEVLSPIRCGDGVLDVGFEECDDGNTDNGDGCNAQCQSEYCGDGVLQPALGEECDDGNTSNGDGCDDVCTIEPFCGDGNVDPGEECDDGNNANGDGCSDVCELENEDPDCSLAAADQETLWPPDHKLIAVDILGVTDPDGDAVTITVDSVYQDEEVNGSGTGAGHTGPDATLDPLTVRAERNGNVNIPGNGRVYHVFFTADDGMGGQCSGEVTVCVPHDQGGMFECVDEGPLHQSNL